MIYETASCLPFEFSQMPVCRSDISVKQHIPREDHGVDQPDLFSDEYVPFQDFVFKVRCQAGVLSDHRVDQTDPGQCVSGMGRIFKAECDVDRRPFRAEPFKKPPSLADQPGKCLLVDIISKETGNTFLLLIQCLYLIT